ncbi:hypothetical protein HPB48_004776 [Haemaphysalis longicornis]|uniref:Uncharacterized protein n=1 Tax=Haemaphysalis longicornis TaxID=44386 RepID=A0A9J6G0I1_HAELO|nr:hypothetical protein HPB48_004776 [Haemaphysalis longicornis]
MAVIETGTEPFALTALVYSSFLCSSDEPTDKRKRPLRFSGQQDIQLLQEVISLNPFKDTPPTTAWASISRNLESVLDISSRRCRERTILMLDQYIKGDLASLQRFCTKDEFTIKEQLLQQVLQQYESGAGGYSTRIGSGMVSSLNTANSQEEEGDDDFDLYKPRVILEEEVTPEPSDNGERERTSTTSSESEDKDDEEQGSSPKRPRLSEDDVLLEEIKAAAAAMVAEERARFPSAGGDGAEGDTGRRPGGPPWAPWSSQCQGGHLPAQLPGQRSTGTQTLPYISNAVTARERHLKIRREELQMEKARLRLEEDKLALERARFEIERQERELRLRSEMQERTIFMEVLKKVFSNGISI